MIERSILVILRVHAGGNNKNRPDWFSKEICVSSIVRSVARAHEIGIAVRSIALVDESGGPLGGELQTLVSKFDEVISHSSGSSRKSWQHQIAHLRRRRDLAEYETLYLVEDDHLHRTEAIAELTRTHADYALLYSLSVRTNDSPERATQAWLPTLRGVSSFAMSRESFARDAGLLSWMSFAGPAFDFVTWHALHRHSYFSWSEIVAPLRPVYPFSNTSIPKAVWQIGWRVIANVVSRFRPETSIVAAFPNLATHAEQGWLSPGVDWAAVASEIDQ